MSGAINRTASEKRKRRDALMQSQAGACHYCGCGLTIGLAHARDWRGTDATFDHVIPKAEGLFGLNRKWNVVLACRQCNNDKGAMSAEHFVAALPAILQRRVAA